MAEEIDLKTTGDRWSFPGTYLTPEVMAMFMDRRLTRTHLLLYLIIQALDGPKGCYASNAYLAEKIGLNVSGVKKAVRQLKGLGLVVQTGFDGRRRTLRAVYYQEGLEAEGPKNAPSEGPKNAPPLKDVKKVNIDPPSGGGGGGASFGLKEEHDTSTTDFDRHMAAKLKDAVKTQPARTTGITQARPSAWANHIRLLRTKDGHPEKDIATVMTWYAEHIGEEFVPQAYSGGSFRKKFPAMLWQAERHEEETVVVGGGATKIAARFKGVGLGGNADKLPGAIQITYNRYVVWRTDLAVFVERIAEGDLVGEYDEKTRKRRLRIGRALMQRLPAAGAYTIGWAERTVKRLQGWDEWSGDFGPLLFSATGKEAKQMCRSALVAHCGEKVGVAQWDQFKEMLLNESN